MSVRKETILNIFPGADAQNRLVIATEQTGNAPGTLVLRQETHADDVGWFVQNRLVIESCQVPGLKMALSGGNAGVCAALGCQSGTCHSKRQPVATILPLNKAVAQQAG